MMGVTLLVYVEPILARLGSPKIWKQMCPVF